MYWLVFITNTIFFLISLKHKHFFFDKDGDQTLEKDLAEEVTISPSHKPMDNLMRLTLIFSSTKANSL